MPYFLQFFKFSITNLHFSGLVVNNPEILTCPGWKDDDFFVIIGVSNLFIPFFCFEYYIFVFLGGSLEGNWMARRFEQLEFGGKIFL